MKISELITALEQAKEKRGDVEIYVFSAFEGVMDYGTTSEVALVKMQGEPKLAICSNLIPLKECGIEVEYGFWKRDNE